MKRKIETLRLAARIWFLSNTIFDSGLLICFFLFPLGVKWIIIPAVFGAAAGSLPVLLILFLSVARYSQTSSCLRRPVYAGFADLRRLFPGLWHIRCHAVFHFCQESAG